MSPASRIPEGHLAASFPHLTLPPGGPPAAAQCPLSAKTRRAPSPPSTQSLPPGVRHTCALDVCAKGLGLLSSGASTRVPLVSRPDGIGWDCTAFKGLRAYAVRV